MHTCCFMLPNPNGIPDHWVHCQQPAIGSVFVTWYDEYAGYCETLYWYCEKHYGDPRNERGWQADNMSYEY